MTRVRRIAQLLQVAEARELDTARALGEHQRALEQEREQLQQLLTYRDEYACQFAQTAERGLRGVSVRNYYLFLNRLDQAIAEQHGRIEVESRKYETSLERWRQTHRDVASLDKAVERLREIERKDAERDEQRQTDEFNRHVRRSDLM